MTTQTRKLKFYLAFQDGRAEGDKEYDNKKEAKAALKRYSKMARQGMCIMSYWREYE